MQFGKYTTVNTALIKVNGYDFLYAQDDTVWVVQCALSMPLAQIQPVLAQQILKTVFCDAFTIYMLFVRELGLRVHVSNNQIHGTALFYQLG